VGVCAAPGNVLYFAREHKGHEGVKGTPVEDYQGILCHDHDRTFYAYGSDHQECAAHVLRYLKNSMENEPDRQWNKRMRELLQAAIHLRNSSGTGLQPAEAEKIEKRYSEILALARAEYEDEPPGDYYRDGYNLYRRMDQYRHNHLLFLHNPIVPATNSLSERLLRIIKRKARQVMTFRSFDGLDYYCRSMSVIASLKAQNKNLYRSVAEIFD
jgi:hypothetical protein